jgi:hypothetical protein
MTLGHLEGKTFHHATQSQTMTLGHLEGKIDPRDKDGNYPLQFS